MRDPERVNKRRTETCTPSWALLYSGDDQQFARRGSQVIASIREVSKVGLVGGKQLGDGETGVIHERSHLVGSEEGFETDAVQGVLLPRLRFLGGQHEREHDLATRRKCRRPSKRLCDRVLRQVLRHT